ncbi:hypothetical protein ILUMI_26208 [Ignelater luminosus]|uniref:RING-type E3 ubiquitin transferase n=1 Tax=Ignelater luminosus TaxID=2038154 RepID=A0A8K0C8F2_IGNLU|nr:hypothetical protein ILUMI_26208 [Ignelater luminosus]
MEKFRCFQCKNYLSLPPIVNLPDGNSLCGICSVSAEETTRKELAFENFLKTLLYPCKFKDIGCKERLKFGEVQDHDANCIYHPRICPVSSSCTWEGSIPEMPNHFANYHSDLIAKKMAFESADEDQSGCILACVDGMNGILKYYYDVSTRNLHYHIYHLNTDVQEMKVKISVINDADPEYRLDLKEDSLPFFNNSFYKDFSEILNPKPLALHSLFPVLNNPDYVRINMELRIVKSGESEQFVDYNLIKDLKCSWCLGYLLPPLYKNTTLGSPICFYCHNQFAEVECELNEELIEKVKKTNFPCRWRGCETIKHGVNLVDHELSCKLRMFMCPVCNEDMIKRECVISHVQQHGSYFENKVQIRTMLQENRIWKLFTLKNHHIIYISCEFQITHTSHIATPKSQFYFILNSVYKFKNDTTLIIQFEHDHCKTNFKIEMKPSMNRTVSLENLPPCFKNDKEILVVFQI